MSFSKEALIDYLVNEFDVEADELQDDTSLFSSGLLDSFMLIDLVSFMEKSGGITINPTEVSLDNLDSVSNILGFMEKKLA